MTLAGASRSVARAVGGNRTACSKQMRTSSGDERVWVIAGRGTAASLARICSSVRPSWDQRVICLLSERRMSSSAPTAKIIQSPTSVTRYCMAISVELALAQPRASASSKEQA